MNLVENKGNRGGSEEGNGKKEAVTVERAGASVNPTEHGTLREEYLIYTTKADCD